MRDRRYMEEDVRGQYSPHRLSGSRHRTSYPLRRRGDSPHHGSGNQGYPRVDRSRRVEKDNLERNYASPRSTEESDKDLDRPRRFENKDKFNRGLSSHGDRLLNYDDRDRERFGIGARYSTSPLRIGRKDNYNRDFSLVGERLCDYDDRGRDRFRVGARRSTSPRGMVKRDDFDREVNTRSTTLSGYDGSKGRLGDVVGVGREMLSDYDGSKGRDRKAVGPGNASWFYDEGMYYVGSTSKKYEQDNSIFVDRSRKLDPEKVKDYNYTSGYTISGEYTTIRSGGGSDSQAVYSNGLHSGLSTMPRSKPVSLDYEMENKGTTDTYSWADNIGDSDVTTHKLAGLEGGSHLSSGLSRYINNDIGKQGYLSLDELELGRRGGALLEPEKSCMEIKDGNYHFPCALELDKPVTEIPVGREEYKHGKKDKLMYSRDNLNGSGYSISLSKTKDYVSLLSGIHKDELGEKMQTVSRRLPGHQSGDLRDRSRAYIGLPMDKHGNVSLSSGTYKDELGEKIETLSSRIGLSTSDELNAHKSSLHKRERELDMLGRGSPDLCHGSESYHRYGSMKYKERHTEMRRGQWSHGERSGVLRQNDYDSFSGRIRDSLERGVVEEKSSLVEPYKRRLVQEYLRDDPLFASGVGIRISTDENGLRMIYNRTNDEMDVSSSKKAWYNNNSDIDVADRALDGMYAHQRSTEGFIPIPRHSSSPRISNCKDIKERLGPRLHVSQRLVYVNRPSVKDRLGPTL